MKTVLTQSRYGFQGPRFFLSGKEIFRKRFQTSLKRCIRHGFRVEESFGMIWEETLEEVALTDAEQGELYEEMIGWARQVGF